MRAYRLALMLVLALLPNLAWAEDKPVVGLIPKAQKPINIDGKLD